LVLNKKTIQSCSIQHNVKRKVVSITKKILSWHLIIYRRKPPAAWHKNEQITANQKNEKEKSVNRK